MVSFSASVYALQSVINRAYLFYEWADCSDWGAMMQDQRAQSVSPLQERAILGSLACGLHFVECLAVSG
jgi:hypothetical protein